MTTPPFALPMRRRTASLTALLALVAIPLVPMTPAPAAITVVGRIAGGFEAQPSGAAAYTIPIQVSAGMNGLKPAVALTYSSQSGNGAAGMGWTLAGFSEIRRCALTRAVDGRVQGVRFTNQDRFCLDGHPLILLSGTHGSAGAQYRSEVHGYEKITAYGQQGSGPAWFELRQPDGTVYRYGNDADSRIEAGGTEVVAWALNEIEDKFQQRVGFNYSEDTTTGEYRPAEIRWTYDASQTFQQGRYRLAFSWEPRPATDVREGFLWGTPWRISQRLATIDYEFDAGAGLARVHRYSLAYTTPSTGGTQRSQLENITQCGPLQCLPPTTMEWDDGSADRARTTISTIPVDKSVTGDFNGDGATDIFGGYQGKWAVWPANPQTGGFLAPVVIGGTYDSTSAGMTLDYNGDGLADLMTSSAQGPTWLVYLAPTTAGGAFAVKNTGVASSAGTALVPLDMDGDGLDDLAYLRNAAVYLRRNTGGAFGAEQSAGLAPISAPQVALAGSLGGLEAADFDGDSRLDLLVARSSNQIAGYTFVWEAFLSNGNGFGPTPIVSLGVSTLNSVLVLDINGDGLDDVLRNLAGAWQSFISHGTTNGNQPGLVQGACTTPVMQSAGSLAAAMDYDGDGRDDLIMPYNSGWRIYQSDGTCFSRAERFTDIAQPAPTGITRVIPVDSHGDGNTDMMFGYRTSNTWELLQYLPRTRPDGLTIAYHPDVLRKISDGLGNSYEPVYRPLAGWSGYQATEASTASARVMRGGPLHVLSQFSTNTGAGSEQYTISLTYANGRLDTLGRGFTGFGNIKATDSRNGVVTETVYRQDFPYTGRVDKTTIFDGTSKVTVDDPTWSAYVTTAPDPAQDTHFVHLTADTSEAYEVDADGGYRGSLVRKTARTLTWNYNHGAVATELTSVSGPQHGSSTYRTTRSLTFDDTLRSAAGCLGFPTRIDITRDISGNGAQTRTTQFSYNSTNCRTLTRYDGPASQPARQLRSSFNYDEIGRLGGVTQNDGSGNSPYQFTYYTYDGLGFRPSAEGRLIGGEPDYVITHQWHDGLGVETSRTSAQGLTTNWVFDEFGRVRRESRVNGDTQTTYTACGPCFAASARYAVRQQRSDGFWMEAQLDSFGRTVGRAFVLPDGHASRQLTEYDTLGRVRRESVPYPDTGTANYWTTYAYDLLGRPKSIDRPVGESAPSGSVSVFTYAGLKTTVRDAEMRPTTYTYDPEGRVTVATAPLGGVAGGTYDVFGQLTSIADASWNTRQMTYDEAGRLTGVTDPDAGQRMFSYDTFGNLLSQSDSTNTATLRYDALGRMIQRTEREGTTTWAFSAAPDASRGQLLKVTGPTDSSATGFQESYVYDSQGRLQRTTTVIDGSSYQTDYAYGAEDQLASMTYPATVGWRPKFLFAYGYGYLSAITQDGVTQTPVYSLLAMDAQGHETAARFGSSALEQRMVFDAASGRLTAIRSGPASSPVSVQNYAYQWDRVGNLLSRQNLGTSPQLQEQFAYDSLDRLTQVTLNGTPALTMSYTADGSIATKSDVGTYQYSMSDQRPHAVLSVSGGPRGSMSFGYDANGNMVNRNGSPITWTSFNLPKQVNAGADYARFTYGPGRARIKQELKSGTLARTIHYVGPHFEVEIEGSARRYRSNVFAHGRAVFSQIEATPNGLEAYYVLHDHLGSVDRLVRAVGSGSDLLAMSFDAWGKRRNTNWSADATDQRYGDAHWVERGYTGHEHLDHARLIHMNGRLEDPLLGRMLSPDPFMGGMTSPQALNAYSYVANDPTSYFDPSGYLLHRLHKALKRTVRHIGSVGRRIGRRWGREIAAAVAAYFTAGAVSSWAYAAQSAGISATGPAFLSAEGVSAAGTLTAASTSSAVIGAAAGGAVAGAITTGDLRGTLVGGLSGGAMSAVGVHFNTGYSPGRVLAEATVGGVSAQLGGGSFGNGFLTSGALSSLTWASLEMREAMVKQSLNNPANASGVSEGFQGDGFKLGGCRAPCTWSPLGGVQGEGGNVFGHAYTAGSFFDKLVETYSGPHDFLNNPIFYDQVGNNLPRGRMLEVFNFANVAVATPFAAASVIPTYAYGAMSD